MQEIITKKSQLSIINISRENIENGKKLRQGGDPHAEGGTGGKITEWEAAWNVTNAIQVIIVIYCIVLRQVSADIKMKNYQIKTSLFGTELIFVGKCM